MSVRVKVCGITNLEDALLAEACGAAALGFIFHPPSPRSVSPEAAAEIVRALHPMTTTVGVFVAGDAEDMAGHINAVAAQCRLDRVQVHGGAPHALLAALERPAYRALTLRSEADVAAAEAAPDATLLLDTYDQVLAGGTGRTGNWAWARRVAATRRVILSGGLRPENVAAALAAVRPAAVDASSGLEAAPGRKDAERVRAFFRAVRSAAVEPEPDAEPDAIAL